MRLTYDDMKEVSGEHSRFVIARRDADDTDVLVLRFSDGRTALPVFGHEEEAGMFLWLETAGEGWYVAEVSEGDLTIMLRGSCAGVRWIVYPFAANDVGKGPATVDREDFLQTLSSDRTETLRQKGGGYPAASRSSGSAEELMS